NEATGGNGAGGGSGGDAHGGGIFNGRVNRFTGSAAALTLSDSVVAGNEAEGGAGGGGGGGNGGDGLGGGLFNGRGPGPVSPPAKISTPAITANQSSGGAAGAGGVAGQGIGGGTYSTGTVFVHHVVVRGNRASTSDDDMFGDLTSF